MFDLFSWSHLLIIAIVALVVVGPKDLPRLMRIGGQWIAKARGMAHEFRQSFDDMARASELDELRKEIESLRGVQQSSSAPSPVDHGILPKDEIHPDPDYDIYAHERTVANDPAGGQLDDASPVEGKIATPVSPDTKPPAS